MGRVSNLLTCVSNATAGFYLGGGDALENPRAWFGSVLAVCFYYESGMVLNDLLDQGIDSLQRPSRPIPSGRVSSREAWILYLLLSVAGTATVALLIPQALSMALLLGGFILLYNTAHRWFVLSPLLMGACRASVYLLAATAAGWHFSFSLPFSHSVWSMTLNLWAYITLLSLIARDELVPNALAFQWVFLSLSIFAFILPIQNTALSWMAALFGIVWLGLCLIQVFSRKLAPLGAVGRMLAAISLLDGLVLARSGAIGGTILAWSCFAGTLLMHRKVKGT